MFVGFYKFESLLYERVVATFGISDLWPELLPSEDCENGMLCSKVAFALSSRLKISAAEVAKSLLIEDFPREIEARYFGGYIYLNLRDQSEICFSDGLISARLDGSVGETLIGIPRSTDKCNGWGYLRLLSLAAIQSVALTCFGVAHRFICGEKTIIPVTGLGKVLRALLPFFQDEQVPLKVQRECFDAIDSINGRSSVFCWLPEPMWSVPELQKKNSWMVRTIRRGWISEIALCPSFCELNDFSDTELSDLALYLTKDIYGADIWPQVVRQRGCDNLGWFLRKSIARVGNGFREEGFYLPDGSIDLLLPHKFAIAGTLGRVEEFIKDLECQLWKVTEVLNCREANIPTSPVLANNISVVSQGTGGDLRSLEQMKEHFFGS